MGYEDISGTLKGKAGGSDEDEGVDSFVVVRERRGAVPNQIHLDREEWVKLGRMAGWISNDGSEIYEDAEEKLAEKVREMREKDSEELTELDDIGEEEDE